MPAALGSDTDVQNTLQSFLGGIGLTGRTANIPGWTNELPTNR